MARPKKWSSEAERVAAYRSIRTDSNRTESEQSVRIERTDSPNRTLAQIEAHARQVSASAGTITEPIGTPSGFVAFRDCPDVPHDCTAAPWIGAGRGTVRPYKGMRYVLVSRGLPDPLSPEHGVVTLDDWHARLGQRCQHGLRGWACHAC